MSIDEQLEFDRELYGVSVERLVDGVRERLDPTTVKVVTVNPNNILFYPVPVSQNAEVIKIETK